MSRLTLSGLLTAACALALHFAGPLRAQCRLCETPTLMRDDPSDAGQVSLQIETGLDFDRLVLHGEGDGSVAIRPDGSTSTHGSVGEVSARAMVGKAVIRGEPGRTVRVELPGRIVLRSLAGGEIELATARTAQGNSRPPGDCPPMCNGSTWRHRCATGSSSGRLAISRRASSM